MTNHYPKMTQLAASFPTLRDAPIEPFDPEDFDTWACGPAPSSGGRHAARFILSVFGGHFGRIKRCGKDEEEMFQYVVESVWGCGLFDIADAMSTWDDQHRRAFITWASDPWWP